MSCLSPKEIKAALDSGKVAKLKHGGLKGLYLYVKNGRGFWLHQFYEFGPTKTNPAPHWHTRTKSLGPLDSLTPAAAVRECKKFDVARHDGETGKPVIVARKVTGDTFGEALTTYLDIHDKIPASTRSLAARFIPTDFKSKSVHALTAKDMRDVLVNGSDDKGPLWTGTGPNRGNRLRLLMLAVFTMEGVRPNPAEWNAEGAQLPHLMPDVEHTTINRKSMPWQDVPAFLRAKGDSIEDRAGLFTTLAAVRRTEALDAQWREFDFSNRVWTVPASRMKMKRVHKVPITDELIAALGTPGAPDEYVFQNKAGGPLSNSHAALDKEWFPVDPADGKPFTLHGMRTSFSTWAQEQDDGQAFHEKVILTAIAHKTQDNQSDAAYLRSTHFEARRKLMAAWSKFATGLLARRRSARPW
jgi:integrase